MGVVGVSWRMAGDRESMFAVSFIGFSEKELEGCFWLGRYRGSSGTVERGDRYVGRGLGGKCFASCVRDSLF